MGHRSGNTSSESSRSDLPTFHPESQSLSAKLKEFRATTRSLESISISDVVCGCDNSELLAAIDGISDPHIKVVLNMVSKIMQDMERRILQKVASESAHFESAFAQLQDILIAWNEQTLEAQRLQKSADVSMDTKVHYDVEAVKEVGASSTGNEKPLPVKPFITYASNKDFDTELHKFMCRSNEAVEQDFPRIRAPASGSEAPEQAGQDTSSKGMLQVKGERGHTSEITRGRLQQQQNTLSRQLQAHQASVVQTTSQLPLWLRVHSSKPPS